MSTDVTTVVSVASDDKPMTIYDLRKRILQECDVLGNIIMVANGKLPETWKHVEGITDKDGHPEVRVLTLGDIVKANYALLARILPELRSIEFVDTTDKNTTAEQSREKFFNAIASRLDAANKAALPDGDTIG